MIALAWPFVALVGLVLAFLVAKSLVARTSQRFGLEVTRALIGARAAEEKATDALARINAAEQRIGSLELRG